MLMNSADPDVAERPMESSAGSDAPSQLQTTLTALRGLRGDETLVVRTGRPVGVFRAQNEGPRVLVIGDASRSETAGHVASWLDVGPQTRLPIAHEGLQAAARIHFGGTLAGRFVAACGLGLCGGALPLAVTLNGAAFLGIDANAEQIKRRVKTGYCEVMVNDLDEALRILKNAVRKHEPASVGLVGNCAEVVPELASRGIVPDLMLDCTDEAVSPGGYIPRGLSAASAAELWHHDAPAYRDKTRESLEAQAKGLLELRGLGSLTYRLGASPNLRGQKLNAPELSAIPDFSTEFIEPLFAQGRALLLWVALSGEPADISRADRLASEVFSADEAATRFLQLAGRHVQFQGLPARVCLVHQSLGAKFGVELNAMVAQGAFRAPILIGRDVPDERNAPPKSNARKDANDTLTETEFRTLVAGLSAQANAASWLLESPDGAPFESSLRLAIAADGTQEMAGRIARMLGSGANSA